MEIDSSRIQDLVNRPSESLSVELKRWIDPVSSEGISKIVRTVLALRNHGGGYLVIGFDNKTLRPDVENVLADVQSAFHIDKIQGLISRFSSEPFEIVVEFPEREGQVYPVIVVPPGVKTPVASKSDLHNDDNKKLISTDDVYVRSLQANNTPSTTKAGWKDWPTIVEVCFDNREADIGRFLRRHLSGLKPETVREFAAVMAKGMEPEISVEDLLKECLQEGVKRFQEVIEERAVELPDQETWEVALLMSGDAPTHSANLQFLSLLDSSNPNYTGWPIWLDSRNFIDESARLYPFEGAWEAFINSLDSIWGGVHLDFMRLDPKGKFYLRRALLEDISNGSQAPEPLKVLDFCLPIIRSAEAIAVGIAFAKAMGYETEHTVLDFAFRWTRLRGRELRSWAQPSRHLLPRHNEYQDEVVVFVNVPLDTPLSALSEYVDQVVQPLYEVFNGFTLSKDVVEDLTRRLVERRL
ncbi:MAG: RNA-binding domain-containing protein [Cyanobacteria bacterium J06638_22]